MSLNREKYFVYEIIKIRIWFSSSFSRCPLKVLIHASSKYRMPTTRRRRARDGSLDARPGLMSRPCRRRHVAVSSHVNEGGSANTKTPSQQTQQNVTGRASAFLLFL